MVPHLRSIIAKALPSISARSPAGLSQTAGQPPSLLAASRFNFQHFHPVHQEHPVMPVSKPHPPTLSPTSTLLSRNHSDSTTSTQTTYIEVTSPTQPIFKKDLSSWVGLTYLRREIKKAQRQSENIHAAFDSLEELHATLIDFFAEAMELSGKTPTLADEKRFMNLARDLTTELGVKNDNAIEEEPEWARPSALITGKVLAQICDGDPEQAQKVLRRISQGLDIRAAMSDAKPTNNPTTEVQNPIIEEETEEKTWQFMQELACIEGYAHAAILGLQKKEVRAERLKGLTEEAAQIVFLQAEHKLRTLDPELSAIPNKAEYAKMLFDPKANQALSAMFGSRKVVETLKRKTQSVKARDQAKKAAIAKDIKAEGRYRPLPGLGRNTPIEATKTNAASQITNTRGEIDIGNMVVNNLPIPLPGLAQAPPIAVTKENKAPRAINPSEPPSPPDVSQFNFTEEERTAYWTWQQGFHENQPGSRLHKAIMRLFKPMIVGQARRKNRDDLDAEIAASPTLASLPLRFERLKDNFWLTLSKNKTPLEESQLLQRDRVGDHSDLEQYNAALNQAITPLLSHLCKLLPSIRDPQQLTQTALAISKLMAWQAVENKGAGFAAKVDEKTAKDIVGEARQFIEEYASIEQASSADDRKKIALAAQKILRKNTTAEIKKLTPSSEFWKLGTTFLSSLRDPNTQSFETLKLGLYRLPLGEDIKKVLRKMPVLGGLKFFSSAPVETLFTVAGLEVLARQFNPIHPNAWTTESQDKFEQAIKTVSDLSFGTGKSLKEIKNVQALLVKIAAEQPIGNHWSMASSGKAGVSFGYTVHYPLLIDAAYEHRGQTGYKMENTLEHGSQLTFSSGKNDQGRLRAGATFLPEEIRKQHKFFPNVSATAGPLVKYKRIKEVSLRAGNPNDDDDNGTQRKRNGAAMVNSYFTVVDHILKNHPSIQNGAKPAISDDLVKDSTNLLAAEFIRQPNVSMRADKQEEKGIEFGLIPRAGLFFSDSDLSHPGIGPAGGMNFKRGYTKQHRFAQMNTQQQTAQGSEKSTVISYVFSIATRGFDTALRVPLLKALLRGILREKQARYQIRTEPDPHGLSFSKKLFIDTEVESGNLEKCKQRMDKKQPQWQQEHNDPKEFEDFLHQPYPNPEGARQILAHRQQMVTEFGRRYTTFSDLEKAEKLHRQNLKYQQTLNPQKHPQKIKNLSKKKRKNTANAKAYRKTMKYLAGTPQAWRPFDLRIAPKETLSKEKGFSFIAKAEKSIIEQRGSAERRLIYKTDEDEKLSLASKTKNAFVASTGGPTEDAVGILPQQEPGRGSRHHR